MMCRAVQGTCTAPQLQSRPSYVGFNLGFMWWLPVMCFSDLEAEDLLRLMGIDRPCFKQLMVV
jgi:hypothetical protein